jgi:hypothetical protein
MNKTPADMFEEKNKLIAKYRNETELNIRVSWAINNATHMTAPRKFENDETAEKSIKIWTKWFLEYYEELREEEVAKRVSNSNEEKAL